MNLLERFDKALSDEQTKEFLYSQMGALRENILEAERRIYKLLTLILSLLAISELINRKIIVRITFFSTEIDQLALVLVVMPCVIAYYTYLLINQMTLRLTLHLALSAIIKSKSPLTAELGLQDYLITHLPGATEEILTSGKKTLSKRLINILSAPSSLFYQYAPLFYCFYLLWTLFQNPIYSKTLLYSSLIITSVFFLRATLLFIAFFEQIAFVENILKYLASYRAKS